MVFGILHHGEVLFTRGVGLADVNNALAPNEHIVYCIASCTKAFTAATCGILVDESVLSWDDPVQKHLPTFQTIHDPTIGKETTLLDISLHGTGLAWIDHLVCGFSR